MCHNIYVIVLNKCLKNTDSLKTKYNLYCNEILSLTIETGTMKIFPKSMDHSVTS